MNDIHREMFITTKDDHRLIMWCSACEWQHSYGSFQLLSQLTRDADKHLCGEGGTDV